MEKYKTKRTDYQNANGHLVLLEQELDQISSRESNLLQAVTILEKKLQSTEKELKSQDEKKIRAIKSVKRIIKDLKQGRNVEDVTDQEYDLKLRLLKDKTNAIIFELIRLGEEQPELHSFIEELFEKVKINLKQYYELTHVLSMKSKLRPSHYLEWHLDRKQLEEAFIMTVYLAEDLTFRPKEVSVTYARQYRKL